MGGRLKTRLSELWRHTLKRLTGRTAIFWLEIVYLLGLGLLAAAYLEGWFEPREHIGSLPTPVIWFGALGAVMLSLTGIFDHPYDWDDKFALWHVCAQFLVWVSNGLVGLAPRLLAIA
jgi:hypothetical protein